MKTFKTMCIRAIAGLGLLVTASFSANATLISQDILSGGTKLGSVTVKMNDALYNTGIASSAFGDDVRVVDFELGDLYSWGDDLEILFSDVDIDTNNLFAGIQFLSVDTDDIGFGADTWSYQAFYAVGLGGYLDVFENGSGTPVTFGSIQLGAASVVSAPGTMGLMMLAMGAVYLRRRRQS